ncbi:MULTISPECIES: HpcH/HpaI aldolase/citrate lyase family protein [Rhodococcus]|uniref:HpcH/HpaI aldolase/citrate lyase family protein n=1 Tax=Rhodococcus TaxID=1827 RepID=UPI0013DDFA95|nr:MULTISPECIES: HpcH/HpaI aldolase/citrate lyase family protein [Rhodococcus]MCT6733617.1 HpcH/HpaI aldolase/citrate lyase family protein [Rhodococcus qingshengii]MDJ0434202.1 HpcH/HpaI aldolase/citrate lyase family protein [Rhodococcus qingshengii]UDF21897.1 HpcH/HpaI aldolase/citrate lyase family protein [Rhodococcus qingshengii]BDQ18151.1 HpcH/HpaI aldolase/citrate lyase family protein [Rhodococcus qingshengii]
MQHFQHLEDDVREQLFLHAPRSFADSDERDLLAIALGATLYVPATRAGLAGIVSKRASEGVSSMVLDLEDAVADHEVESARANAVEALDKIASTDAVGMLLFVRVREVADIHKVAASLTEGRAALTGFVIPKFGSESGPVFLDAVADASELLGKHLYAMPVLESPALVHRDTRDLELRTISGILAQHRDRILAVRIGATDMCSTFGIRRDRDLTIYDVRVVVDVIADIVNYLGRADGSGFVITGPVWEYFADHERMFRPMLRATPFEEHDAVRFRQHLVSRDLDGLLREIALDRANGIQGKTVIHPSHVAAVNALSAVTHEEYHDALDILGADAGGVQASGYRNKMNEMKPHRNWAHQTALRAHVFGVTNKGITFVELLTALVDR